MKPDSPRHSFSSLKIALVADELTSNCLDIEAHIKHVTPLNYAFLFRFWRPDFLMVESAWGTGNAWKFKIASYPDYPRRNNKDLIKVVTYARKLGIPTVFWNKEDGIHFDRFIDSAKLFEYIFTVDANSIPKYRAIVDGSVTVNPLMFAVQPEFHNFTGFSFKCNRANFVGSYSSHIHSNRRLWQEMYFKAACNSGLGLTIVDRNSNRKSNIYRYPDIPGVNVVAAMNHKFTGNIYKDYLVSLNVNTIENSKTMFSRRLVEILACGGIAVTNRTPSVHMYFKDYTHVLGSYDEAFELFSRLKSGPSKSDLERAEAGARYVLAHHTWGHRLHEICQVLGL